MLFHRFVDHEASANTYLLGCERSFEAVLINPRIGQVETYLGLLYELDYVLTLVLETHADTQHLAAARLLHSAHGSRFITPALDDYGIAGRVVSGGEILWVGNIPFSVQAASGQDSTLVNYRVGNLLFTGSTFRHFSKEPKPHRGETNAKEVPPTLPGQSDLPPGIVLYPCHYSDDDTRGHAQAIDNEARRNTWDDLLNRLLGRLKSQPLKILIEKC